MNCTNCGIELSNNEICEDGYYFCNNLCRYTWRQNGKPNPYDSIIASDVHQDITNIDMDFSVNPIGFENREMNIRLSYFTGPKLFLDGIKLKPTRKKILSRNREFEAISNFGKPVKLKLNHRILDFVPKLIIEDKEFRFVRPLKVWEYFWICIPLILLFAGGAIGSLLATAAAFSNSILMRKIKPLFLRYLFTGITSFMALFFYVRFIGFFHPYILNIISPKTVNETLIEFSYLVNNECPQMIDNQTRIDSAKVRDHKILVYYYTLPTQLKSELNSESLKQYLKPQIISNIKNSERMKFIRENDITLVYKYLDKNNSNLFELDVTPSDYNSSK